MTSCIPHIAVDFHQNRPVEVHFDAPDTSSDGGFILLRYADDQLGLSDWFSRLLPDKRCTSKVRHSRQEQIRQRLLQIAMGYEDNNDANTLRNDPLLKMACASPSGVAHPLSSQPTLSRLENAVDMKTNRELRLEFENTYVAALPEDTDVVILDIDSTEDPTHGSQQLSFFNAHYDNNIYHPLMIFDAISGQLISALLRPGRVGAARGALSLLRCLIRKLKTRFPMVQIVVRGDSAFAAPHMLLGLEQLNQELGDIDYLFGFSKNSVAIGHIQVELDAARQRSKASGQSEVVFTHFEYAAGTWPYKRHIIGKAEHNGKGMNPRFLVTTLRGFSPDTLYHAYCERGQCENFIKDFKNALSADRLSCSSFAANSFRLLLHAAAYRLMFALRQQIAKYVPSLKTAQFDTIRLKLLKVATAIKRVVRRIYIRLPRAFPLASGFRRLTAALAPQVVT